MKKAPLIISIIALLGVILLFVQQNSTSTPKKTKKKNSEIVNIAYVKLDTLIDSYHFFNEKKTVLLAQGQEKQQDLESRFQALQRKAYNIQSQVQNRMMTPSRAQKKQEQLALEQQKIMEDKQTYELEIMEMNQDLMRQVLDSIKNYVKIYNQDYGFDMIMTNDTLGSTVLYAEEQMDITPDIIDGLNKRYSPKKYEDESEGNE